MMKDYWDEALKWQVLNVRLVWNIGYIEVVPSDR